MIFQTLKFRLIILSLAVLALGVALRFGVALPLTKEKLQQLAASQQLNLASYVARDLGRNVETRLDLMGRLAQTLPLALLQKPEAFNAWVAERRSMNPLLPTELLLMDGTGKLMQASALGPSKADAQAFSDKQWFKAALSAREPVLGKPEIDPAQGPPTIVIAAPIRDGEHHVSAVLAGVFKLEAYGLLSELRDSAGMAVGGLLLVSPEDRMFIGSSDPAMKPAPTPAAGRNLLLDQAMAGYRGTGVTINVNGIEELAAATGVPGTNWFVIAHMPTAQAFLPLYLLEKLALQGSLLGLAGILAIMLLALPRMLLPLTNTARAMREIADGKRELKPLPIRRNDEIGSMVLGFNYLVTRLGEKEAALKESEIRLSFLAHHDSLTGLYNRAMLEHRIQQALDRAARNGTQFALLFCDLDGFKDINDAHGHKTGDIVLTQVAARLQSGRKHTDTIARLGGDEFVILLAELGNARTEAETAARHYLEQIGKPYQVNDKTFNLSISIGIALYRETASSVSQLLSQADIAMYRAKRTGKDGHCFFEDSMTGHDCE